MNCDKKLNYWVLIQELLAYLLIESIKRKSPCVSDTTCEWHNWYYEVPGDQEWS